MVSQDSSVGKYHWHVYKVPKMSIQQTNKDVSNYIRIGT